MALTEVNSLGIKDLEVKTADIAAANVTLAKVENVTDGQIIVGNGSNRPTAVAVSGDVTLANTGAVTIASGAVEHAMLAGDAVDGDNLADNACDSEHYTDGSIDHAHLAGDCVDGDNLADNACDSEHYTDGSIDHVHLAADAVDGDNIADDSINSEHYIDGSIDTAHIADDQVTLAKMAGLARGRLIVGDDGGNPSALALGSDNYVLTSDGTDVGWEAAAGGGKCLQVQVAYYSTESNTNSSNWGATGLTCNITPASSSNYIVVLVYMNGIHVTNHSATNGIRFRLKCTTSGLDVEEYFAKQTGNLSEQGSVAEHGAWSRHMSTNAYGYVTNSQSNTNEQTWYVQSSASQGQPNCYWGYGGEKCSLILMEVAS